MDDIFSLDSLRLIKQQSAPGTPKSIHQHLCELSDFCTGRLALCEKYPKISASHQCILLLAALMSGQYQAVPFSFLWKKNIPGKLKIHNPHTQASRSLEVGQQNFGNFLSKYSHENYREQNLCLTGQWLCYFTSCVLVIYLPSLIICTYFDLLYYQHCSKN